MAEHYLIVEPGAQLRITFNFNTPLAHRVVIKDFASGETLKEFHTDSDRASVWESPVNNSRQVRAYILEPSVRAMLCERLRYVPTQSRVVVDEDSNKHILFGFEEDESNEFEMGLARVKLEKVRPDEPAEHAN
jgi:hypothetical protein